MIKTFLASASHYPSIALLFTFPMHWRDCLQHTKQPIHSYIHSYDSFIHNVWINKSDRIAFCYFLWAVPWKSVMMFLFCGEKLLKTEKHRPFLPSVSFDTKQISTDIASPSAHIGYMPMCVRIWQWFVSIFFTISTRRAAMEKDKKMVVVWWCSHMTV